MNIPLQDFVERCDCKYFVENDTGDGEVVNLALRSPFIRLYAATRNAARLTQQKHRFQDNERVQLFLWTHPGCWINLVRLVPAEFAAVFWLHSTENVGRALVELSRLRPARADVVLFEPAWQRGVVAIAEDHFGKTHRIISADELPGVAVDSEESTQENNIKVLFPRAVGRFAVRA